MRAPIPDGVEVAPIAGEESPPNEGVVEVVEDNPREPNEGPVAPVDDAAGLAPRLEKLNPEPVG